MAKSIISLLLSCLSMAMAAEPLPGGVLGNVWGSPVGNVAIPAPGKEVERDASGVYGTMELCGQVFKVVLQCPNGKLESGGLLFSDRLQNHEGYIDLGNKIRALLVEKYGKPAKDDEIWISDVAKMAHEDNKAMALMLEQIVFQTQWNDKGNFIRLKVSTKNRKTGVVVLYGQQEAEARKAASSKDSDKAKL